MGLGNCPNCMDDPCTCGHMGYYVVHKDQRINKMNDGSSSKKQLRDELKVLKQRIKQLEARLERK